MDEVVDGVLLGDRQLGVLEQASPVLVRHSVLVENIERNDPDLVEPAVKIKGEGRVSRQRGKRVV